MTIIVATSTEMVADSASVAGGRIFQCGAPKIRRLPDGSLIGCCGPSDDCFAFTEWAATGFLGVTPILTANEEGFRALHLRTDGSVWTAYSVHRWVPCGQPEFIGEHAAVSVAFGAMVAGASAEDAVAIAIKHTVWVGGPIQVEHLAR